MSEDPVLQFLREQIAGLDRQLLETLNRRIRLVAELKAHKEVRGLPFHDPAQEERVLARLQQANEGPLSEEGLAELFRLILAWSKREAARGVGPD